MRKSIIGLGIALLGSIGTLQAQPVSALDYSPSRHSMQEIKSIYKDLFKKDKLKGDDCFKRAYIWSYQMVQKYNARPIKVFFHYTNKFNRELDSQGETGFIARRLNGGSSIVWDFHVAPAVENENGEIIVFDPVVFPNHGGAMPLNTWIQKLANRGEFFLKRRARKLKEDLIKYTKRVPSLQKELRTATAEEKTLLKSQLKEAQKKLKKTKETMINIGVSKDGSTQPITCREIEHIEEFDKNQDTEWCHYQKTSMYYFATGELRALNYGTLGYHAPGKVSTQSELNAVIGHTLRYPINPENLNTKKYFKNGKTMYNQKFYDDGANYQVTEFSDYYLWMSLGEFRKAHRPELEFFKTYLTSKDKELERKLEEEEEERERAEKARKKKLKELERAKKRKAKALKMAQEKRQRELEREERRRRRNS